MGQQADSSARAQQFENGTTDAGYTGFGCRQLFDSWLALHCGGPTSCGLSPPHSESAAFPSRFSRVYQCHNDGPPQPAPEPPNRNKQRTPPNPEKQLLSVAIK
ncbi:hypothetical protein NDU88_004065 [Pleurodeles waltl]|uniref:Uncharacterized protein n=1 Tax=Pleurodeles waltl TaxID=8319 RepID=A0AAV7V063_PLEWA|nr:hypothetical protein NDU88_004065 [Pleurodeles waltl]